MNSLSDAPFDTANNGNLFMTHEDTNDIGIIWPSARELFASSSSLTDSVTPIMSNGPTIGCKPQDDMHDCSPHRPTNWSQTRSSIRSQGQPYQPAYPDIQIHDDAGILTTSLFTASLTYPPQQESKMATSTPSGDINMISHEVNYYLTGNDVCDPKTTAVQDEQHGTRFQQTQCDGYGAWCDSFFFSIPNSKPRGSGGASVAPIPPTSSTLLNPSSAASNHRYSLPPSFSYYRRRSSTSTCSSSTSSATQKMEKRFLCHECNEGFTRERDLKRHLTETAKHSSERPFLCHICCQGFTRRSDLLRHEGSKAHMRRRARSSLR